MNIILSSLNAKFIHTSLSIYSLKSYLKDKPSVSSINVSIDEFTINNNLDYCLKSLIKKSPDVICFSCYIWNIEETKKLCKDIKSIMPSIKIILGGPEVSYNPSSYMDYSDFVVIGEGEVPFLELLEYFLGNRELSSIDSICYKDFDNIVTNYEKHNLPLSEIPFVYDEIDSLKNKILYYESSRGCPYSCSYCLSSSSTGVRFLPEERVLSDLNFFLANKPKQVKFVDRTFNANKNHALMIWKHLILHDNGVTNFHFEISANTITHDMIDVLRGARAGLFQFEIGVQTTNQDTLNEIDRKIKTALIFETVLEVLKLKNIHVHLDLIAGLPYENFDSFRKSFNDTYKLYPHKLQLGFLKLLNGSSLRLNSSKYGIIYRDYAPYEVLKTADISFLELETLKGIESMLDIYYNSGRYPTTIKYAQTLYSSPFDMYLTLYSYFENDNIITSSMPKSFYQSFLYTITKNDFVRDLLRYDLLKEENISSLPDVLSEKIDLSREFTENIYNDENIFSSHISKNITKKQYIRNSRIEKFNFDILDYLETGNIVEKECYILFDYYKMFSPKDVTTRGLFCE